MRRELAARARSGSDSEHVAFVRIRERSAHGQTRHAFHRPVGRPALRGHLPEGSGPGATTAWRSPAGATTWTSARPRPTRAMSRSRRGSLAQHGLKAWALGAHLAGQCVGDPTTRGRRLRPGRAARASPEKIRHWAIQEMKDTARAAKNMGCTVVTGFMGSPIWQYWYSFPPTTEQMVDDGLQGDRRALDADPRRVRPVRRQVRPGGPPDRDRLRLLHGRAAARGVQAPADARLQLRPQPPASGRG